MRFLSFVISLSIFLFAGCSDEAQPKLSNDISTIHNENCIFVEQLMNDTEAYIYEQVQATFAENTEYWSWHQLRIQWHSWVKSDSARKTFWFESLENHNLDPQCLQNFINQRIDDHIKHCPKARESFVTISEITYEQIITEDVFSSIKDIEREYSLGCFWSLTVLSLPIFLMLLIFRGPSAWIDYLLEVCGLVILDLIIGTPDINQEFIEIITHNYIQYLLNEQVLFNQLYL